MTLYPKEFPQLLMRLKDSSKFAMQLDESIDISKMAQLLLFVRYIYKGSIREDILKGRIKVNDRTRSYI